MGASVVLWRVTVEDHHEDDVRAESDGTLDAETRGGDPTNEKAAGRAGETRASAGAET
jgi:hypothetical protein